MQDKLVPDSTEGIATGSNGTEHPASHIPLCVDLDGTLIRSDMWFESLVRLWFSKPWMIFICIWWLYLGRARFKMELRKRISINPATLPYNNEVVDFIRDQRRRGREVLLVSGSDIGYVQPVADHLGLFSQVIASDGNFNVSGRRKRNTLVSLFGEKGFDYIGNSWIDLPVWKSSGCAYVVTHSPTLVAKAKLACAQVITIATKPPVSVAWIREMRVHQWIKNSLVFVPIVMAHRVLDLEPWRQSLLAFFAFSLCASAVYWVNDILDIEADRNHVRKRLRPFASGDLPVIMAIPGVLLLFASAAAVTAFLPLPFAKCLLGYAIATFVYSLVLKPVAIADVVLLSLLYASRVVGGAFASSVIISPWLIVFSMFFFLSLACIKRYSELIANGHPEEPLSRRGYRGSDSEHISQCGVASGFISIMVMALYVDSREVQKLYSSPEYIWFLCPLMLYWIGRTWLLAHRGDISEDPIVFALKDHMSYVVGALCVCVIVAAI